MAAKGRAGEEFIQTVCEVRSAGGYGRPPSVQEMGLEDLRRRGLGEAKSES